MRTFLLTYDELSLVLAVLLSIFFSIPLNAQATGAASTGIAQIEPISLRQSCINALKVHKSFFKEEALEEVCAKAEVTDGCYSVEGTPLFHYDYQSKQANAEKILVMSLIHGDETPAGALGRFWMERLAKIDARNSWRVIPVVNPDGVKRLTRPNARGIDLNRNFPTKDWDAEALQFWEKRTHKSNRKFPGSTAGTEPEVKCVIKHLEDYKPDFVISIHTPLNVLDFDGPRLKTPPKYSYLPWRSLGNFAGSLGRYLWVERNTPVLTTELKDGLPATATPFEQLQDLVGTLVRADLKTKSSVK